MPTQLIKALRRYDEPSRLRILQAWDAFGYNEKRRYERRLRWASPGMRRRSANKLARQWAATARESSPAEWWLRPSNSD
jgi:hypothetical protein